jgi:hypothetical protein
MCCIHACKGSDSGRFPITTDYANAAVANFLAYSLTVLALNRKTSTASHMVSSRVSADCWLSCVAPRPQSFSILDISCSLCVTSTRIPATHHIIVAAPDGSEHSEPEIRLACLDKDVLM